MRILKFSLLSLMLIFSMFLGSVGYKHWVKFTTERRLRSLDIDTVRRGTLRKVLSYHGKLKATRSRSISAPITGQIVYLAPEGKIKKGDLLFKIDTTSIEEELKSKELERERKEGELQALLNKYKLTEREYKVKISKLETEYKIALNELYYSEVNLQRKRRLVEKEILPRRELELAQLEYAKQKANLKKIKYDLEAERFSMKVELQNISKDIEVKRAELKEVELEIAQKRAQINSAEAVAPSDGVVIRAYNWSTSSKYKEGDRVHKGWIILELPDTSDYYVEFTVPQDEYYMLKLGQRATVKLEGSQIKLRGKVSYISEYLSQPKWWTGQMPGFSVEVRFMYDELKRYIRELKPNSDVEVEVEVARVEDAIYVRWVDLWNLNGKVGIFKLSENGVKFLKVKTGLRTEGYVQIRDCETELRAGDKVLRRTASNEEFLKRYHYMISE